MKINFQFKDKIALSFFSGIFGTLVMYSIGIPMYFLKFTKLVYFIYDIELFVTPHLARTTYGFISGMLTGLIVGGLLAFGFKLILEWTGSDWIWLKSIAYGGLMWFVWVGLVRNLLNTAKYLFNDLGTNMILLGQSLIYILATTYFMIKLSGDKKSLEHGENK